MSQEDPVKQNTLSVVVCAQNAEAHIEGCLKTLLWADELVVWDNESSDRTVEMARKYTPHVFVKKMDIEGAYRNFTFTQTRHPWVMYVDPDERVPEPLRDEIIRTLKAREDYAGYSIPRKNVYAWRYWIRHGGLYPSPQLRIFLKDRFRFEEVEIHGRNFLEGKWRYLTQPIVHHIYADFAQMVKKTNRQTSLEVIKWERDGRSFSVLQMFRKSSDRFFKSFVIKKGWRDGFIGLMIGFLSSFYQTTSFLKRWEQKYPRNPGLFDRIQDINERTTEEVMQRRSSGVLQFSLWGMFITMTGKFWGFYLLKGGISHGVAGLTDAYLQGFEVFLRYAKIWEVLHPVASRANEEAHL